MPDAEARAFESFQKILDNAQKIEVDHYLVYYTRAFVGPSCLNNDSVLMKIGASRLRVRSTVRMFWWSRRSAEASRYNSLRWAAELFTCSFKRLCMVPELKRLMFSGKILVYKTDKGKYSMEVSQLVSICLMCRPFWPCPRYRVHWLCALMRQWNRWDMMSRYEACGVFMYRCCSRHWCTCH